MIVLYLSFQYMLILMLGNTLFIVSLGSAEYQQNSSNYDKSMKLGMMVGIDHTNRFRVVDKMKYAYLGQRSRSKFTIE